MSDDYTAAGASHRSEDYGLSETNLRGPAAKVERIFCNPRERQRPVAGGRPQGYVGCALSSSGTAGYRKNQLSVKRQDAVLVRDRWAG